uniref:Uncharacterized protein n=1 Tax=Rhizophora mucronata TaxID=61149 RepID=A0A2P2NJF2_RHIMU
MLYCVGFCVCICFSGSYVMASCSLYLKEDLGKPVRG